MQKPNGWDNVTPVESGSYQKLPAGGHVCEIIEVKMTKSRSGKDMMVICFDVKGGEYDSYFRKQFEHRIQFNSDASWPNGGIYRQLTDSESLGRFKGMLIAIEKSNPGYKWDWNEKSLKGKKFGGLFREEEYLRNDGNIGTAVRCMAIRNADGIEDEPVPNPKTLDTPQRNNGYSGSFNTFLSPSDEEVPF